MTTEAQLDAWHESENFMRSLERRALQAITDAGPKGATYDEAYDLANPTSVYQDHASVDSFRVAIRHLREDGHVMDGGTKRMSQVSGRDQTVWLLGDDRDVVERQRRAKLKKFPTDWLLDELKARGIALGGEQCSLF